MKLLTDVERNKLREKLGIFESVLVEMSIPERTIYHISAEKKKEKKYITHSYGMDESHCLLICYNHNRNNFRKEARYFHISQEMDKDLEDLLKIQPKSVKVEFYGDI